MRRSLRFLVVAFVTLGTCVLAAEIGRRVLDGFSVSGLALSRNPNSTDLTWSSGLSPEALVRTIKLDIEAEPSWFWDRPQPSRQQAPEWAEQRRLQIDPAANYVWNAATIRGAGLQAFLQKQKGRLDEFFTFKAPYAEPNPAYRLHPDIESGFGFTNSFGWRGPQIALNRPGRTIRIGVLGDSTTNIYPELLAHWLNLWAVGRGLDLKLEVVNAARPGTSPVDAAAILDFELSAIDPDYVIVYGFGNGVSMANSLIALPPGVIKGQPQSAPPTPGRTTHALDRIGAWLTPLVPRSAAAGFLQSRLTGQWGGGLSPEPPKPATRIVFPPGIDEFAPNHDAVANFPNDGLMGLESYIRSLNRMDRIVKQRGIGLFVSTFRVLAFDGMMLSKGGPDGSGVAYRVFNEQHWWPYTYAQVEELMAFYNRTLQTWAEARGHYSLPIDEQMPRRPELYGDGMHELPTGEALHAWIVLQQLLPVIRRDLAQGRRPRPVAPQALDDSYWTIERHSTSAALAAGLADAYVMPPEPADEISDALPLAGLTAAVDTAAVVSGKPAIIKTSSAPSAYAASIQMSPPHSGNVGGRGWVGVQVKVTDGGASIGILDRSAQRYLVQLALDPARGLHYAYMTVEDLSDVGSLMISNRRQAEGVSTVELHDVVVKRFRR